ncbi:MAG: glycosyltransferase, partial [Dehalococcoidia bacterium]
MKVVHVLRSLEFGGAEKLVLELARRQKESGSADVSLACLKDGGLLMKEALSSGLSV